MSFSAMRVNLDATTIDASNRLGMIIVQPRYDIDGSTNVPFRIQDEYRQGQCNLIEKAFKIRKFELKQSEQTYPIPFILFPEYSLPYNEPHSLRIINEQMIQAQDEVVFIGGLEGLDSTQVDSILQEFPPISNDFKPNVGRGTFVNLCVIVVKDKFGNITWHYQAKINPSKWEQRRSMAYGERLLYFSADNLTFCCQTCFDSLAAVGERLFNELVCEELIKIAGRNSVALDYIFVPQHNEKPSNSSQIKNTKYILNKDSERFIGRQTTIVVVNRASEKQEPSSFGYSGFHYKSNRWERVLDDVGPVGYEYYDSNDTTSAIFRKRTQAIHLTTVIPPSENVGDPGNLRLPLSNPRSYLIGENCECISCPINPIPSNEVGKYVECDCLPCKLNDIALEALPTNDVKRRWECKNASQSSNLEGNYSIIRIALLTLKLKRAYEIAQILLNSHEGNCGNPDLWSKIKCDSIIELLVSLSILEDLKSLNLQARKYWTCSLNNNLSVVVMDGEDRKHFYSELIENYLKKFENEYYSPDFRKNPVLFVALRSKGALDNYVEMYTSDITKPANRETTIYTQSTPKFYVCLDSLFEGAKSATNISDFMKNNMRCIYE